MAAVVALVLAILALVCSSAGVWALLVRRHDRRSVDLLAEQLVSQSRIDLLTLQTLAAMRDAARRAGS